MLLSDTLTRYLQDLTIRRGGYTVRNQTVCLTKFTAFLQSSNTPQAEDLTLSHARSFLASLAPHHFRPKTIKGYVIALRGWVRFLHDEGLVAEDWSAKLQGPRITERRADPLTHEEWTRFFAAIPHDTPAQLRDHLFFQLLIDTGLRLNEILTLTLPDVRRDQQLLIVRHGKNDKDRAIPLTQTRTHHLKTFIEEVRPTFVHPNSPPTLFLSAQGRPLHPCTVRDKVRYNKVRLYARRAGITRRVYPHMFRATFATRLDLAHVNLTVIQELMGHADIKTTARYVGVAGKEMRAAIETLDVLGPNGT